MSREPPRTAKEQGSGHQLRGVRLRQRLARIRQAWGRRLHALRRDALVVYYAARDPRLPWGVRLLALAVAAYALSPIDLVPDFIPVLGYLDDLVLVPLGVALVIRWAPSLVLIDARLQAAATAARPVSRIAAAVIVLAWLVTLLLAWLGWRRWRG
ncbi:YkvA family protein [Cognatiluteimonas telluris]|uniref:YkvA family protein n=1 Tax=Cognatiluteimonas telluris TaxID=1104775 RepID=UPI001FAEF5B7|nr:DUF1232 domain-containing protein [Lysobacter telluris]